MNGKGKVSEVSRKGTACRLSCLIVSLALAISLTPMASSHAAEGSEGSSSTSLIAASPAVNVVTQDASSFKETRFVRASDGMALGSDRTLWRFANTNTPYKVFDDVIDFADGATVLSNGDLYLDPPGYLYCNPDGEWHDSRFRAFQDVAKVSCTGYGVAAVKTDGSLWTWGRKDLLGRSIEEEGDCTPTKILDNIADVALGEHFGMALSKDGSLYTWGNLLGNGTENSSDTPIKIMDGIASISAGSVSAAAIRTNGALLTWGDNICGQLGIGTTDTALSPQMVMSGVSQVYMGHSHCGAVKADGTAWMWGDNRTGELGDGTHTAKTSPVKILDHCRYISANGPYYDTRWSCAVSDTGALLAWGARSWIWGAAHNGIASNSVTEPQKIMENVKSFAAGYKHSAAVTSDGTLWTWGFNKWGELGDGTTEWRSSPVNIMTQVDKVSLGGNGTGSADPGSFSAAIKTDESLWTWGSGEGGQLGTGLTSDSLSPVKIMDSVRDVSLGENSGLAIKTDGSLWMWGSGYAGNGEGYAEYATPVKVMDNVIWARAEAVDGVAFAIKSDNTLWAWGNNRGGLVGNGKRDSYSGEQTALVPVKILDNAAQACTGSGGVNGKAYAVTTNGVLYSWGPGDKLRVDTTEEDCTPQQVRSGVKQVDSSFLDPFQNGAFFAILEANGSLLLNDASVLDDVESFALAKFYGGHIAALKNDASLWAWGYNGEGQLGLGWSCYQETPIYLVGSETLELSECDIFLAQSSFTYDGTAKQPLVNASRNGVRLTQGIDYSVAYSANINAGTGTALITGMGDYIGTKTLRFTISPKNLSSCTMTLSPSSYTYDGAQKTPTITVKDGNTTLTSGTHYSVTTTPSGRTDVGTYTYTVTGKGNYTGTKSASFTVSAKPKTAFVWGSDNYNFNNTGYTGHPDYFRAGRYIDQINGAYLSKLSSNLTNTEYKYVFTDQKWSDGSISKAWIYEDWNGSCYGMSATTLLAKEGLLPYTSYKTGATKLNQLEIPQANINLSSLITYYQMLQIKEVIQQQYRTVKNRSNQENIRAIISNLDANSTVLVGYRQDSWGGHAVLAYGYEYGSWTRNGVTYGGRIKICDPNSAKSQNDKYNIYFNTNTYSWAVPAYSQVKSSSGAKFNYVGASIADINQGGYLGSTASSSVSNYVARIDAPSISDNRSVSKVAESSGGSYVERTNAPGEIEEDYSYVLTGEREGLPGYNLYDAESAYKVSQQDAENLQLVMQYKDCTMSASSVAGESVVFDKDGYVEVNGESANYSISMTYDNNNPTDWITMSIMGSGANKASLEKLERGYVLSSDNLSNVKVEANSKDEAARTAFSTSFGSAYIYEIDKNTIGVSVDADGNGSYETVIADESSTSSSEGATVTKVMEAINSIPDVSTLKASDEATVQAARKAYETLTDEQKEQVGDLAYQRLAEAEVRIAQLKKPSQTITASNKAVAMGKTIALGAKTNGDGTLSYKSSDTKVAKVDAGGKITPVKVGKAAITVTAAKTAKYKAATKTIAITVIKGANPVIAKGKTITVKASKAKERKQVFAAKKAFSVTKAQGKVTYKKISGNKKIAIARNGKVTVKKGAMKGTYKIKVKATAAGNANWKAKSRTVTLKVKIK